MTENHHGDRYLVNKHLVLPTLMVTGTMVTYTLVTGTMVTDTHHVAELDGGDPGLYDGPQTPEQVGGHSKPGQQTQTC